MENKKVIIKCIDDIIDDAIEKMNANEVDTRGTKENPYLRFVNEHEYKLFKPLFNEEDMRCADFGWQKLVLVPKRNFEKITVLSSVSGQMPTTVVKNGKRERKWEK